MPRFLLTILTFTVALAAFVAQPAQAGRYGGYRYVRPRIIENVFVPPPQVGPPPAASPPIVSTESDAGTAQLPADLTAEDAARRALESMANPDQKDETPQPAHIGKWTANVGTQIRVWLTLHEDGTFQWSVINDVRRNGYQGTYVLENGELTLQRADGNSLKLELTELDIGFNLRAPNARDAGLDFLPR